MMHAAASASRRRYVTLSSGSELNTQIQAYAAGQAFWLPGGTYRVATQISPKNNMKLVGDPNNKPVLNGSKVISSGWTNVSGVWHANLTGFSQSPFVYGSCDANRRCDYPNDCYVDNTIYTNVTTQAAVTAGSTNFFINYSANPPVLYIGTDPTGHTVEVTFSTGGIAGAGTGVQLHNLITEKFATRNQVGSIETNTGWRVNNCEMRYNHGMGFTCYRNAVIRYCNSHHNGMSGYGGGGTPASDIGAIIDNCTLAYNNTTGVDKTWEAGAGKVAECSQYTVSNNSAHDNNGNGIWFDIDCYQITCSGNSCYNNWGAGIVYEISYDAVISYNILYDNGAGNLADVGGNQYAYGSTISQLFLGTSQNVEAHHNTIVGGQNSAPHGILMVQQDRGTGSRGAYNSTNNNFHDNDVKVLGTSMFAFFFGNGTGVDIVASTSIENNHYHLNSTSRQAFDWGGAFKTFASWQSTYGFDTPGGSVDTNQTAYP